MPVPNRAPREAILATICGVTATAALAALVIVGSRNLANFDAALVAYTFATLFAVFGITYRYAMWLQRPPTAMMWRRGWQLFFRPRWLGRNVVAWFRKVGGRFALNDFIWRRGKGRWAAHWLIMWGCVIAGLITFPLVFGWIHFTTPEGDFGRYQVHLFGFEVASFPLGSALAFTIFHGLVWSALLVIPGVMLAMRRRMTDRGAAAEQQFGEDFLPLILLFAISVTGLMLTASYTWMRGYAYDFLAILHAVTVILALLWLPFGKFFHVFQRPAQLGASFYREIGAREEQARCARCGGAYAPRQQIDDLEVVTARLGYRYQMPDRPEGHYQRICPRCRRVSLALAQGRLWTDARGPLEQSGPTSADVAALLGDPSGPSGPGRPA
ncbi:MAG TPA: MFS transporter [Thermoanaerobaculia bacterium]|nr:MFS transporter [Thermoanaerobaculia bacterium]